jgi:hypothetical protein
MRIGSRRECKASFYPLQSGFTILFFILEALSTRSHEIILEFWQSKQYVCIISWRPHMPFIYWLPLIEPLYRKHAIRVKMSFSALERFLPMFSRLCFHGIDWLLFALIARMEKRYGSIKKKRKLISSNYNYILIDLFYYTIINKVLVVVSTCI